MSLCDGVVLDLVDIVRVDFNDYAQLSVDQLGVHEVVGGRIVRGQQFDRAVAHRRVGEADPYRLVPYQVLRAGVPDALVAQPGLDVLRFVVEAFAYGAVDIHLKHEANAAGRGPGPTPSVCRQWTLATRASSRPSAAR